MKIMNRYEAPWERYFRQVFHPIEEFIHYKSAGGILLIVSVILAFALVNSPLHDPFEKILNSELSIIGSNFFLHMNMHTWINEGLMTLFFLLMGLEIKREFLVGELSSTRKATLPIVAALGGMIAPALLFLVFNPEMPDSRGWGVPMATDIAFAVGVLTLLGDRVPRSLFVFLISLAIVDDIGAVIVIALYYSTDISLPFLLYAGTILICLALLNYGGVRSLAPYLIFGALLWLFLLHSGLHATLAGIFLAFTIPVRPKTEPSMFSKQVRSLLDQFDSAADEGEDILINNHQRAIIVSLMEGAKHTLTPLQRLQHALHMPVAFIIIPLFALANAGIPINLEFVQTALVHPISLGVIAGLLFGKVIGVCGASMLAVFLGFADLPVGVNFRKLFGASLLAGIGFTMSIFIAKLAFILPVNQDYAQVGVVIASCIAAALGTYILWNADKIALKT